MKKQLEQVKEFHDKFNVKTEDIPTSNISIDECRLRYDLMKEENLEYETACYNNDLVEIADALGDQLYILCGTILRHGLQHKIEEVFDEIQASNMSKLDENSNSILREDGKILKGNNYFKPDLKKILDK